MKYHLVAQVSDSQLKRVRQYNAQKHRRKARVVVYSANIAGYDRCILPEYIIDDWDYVLFTDGDVEGEHVYEIRRPDCENTDPKRISGYLKTHPHDYFLEYEYSVWIDAQIQVVGPHLELAVKDCIQRNVLYMGCPHSQKRKSIYEVLTACIIAQKDDPLTMAKQVKRYMKEGYPDNLDILENYLIIRRHNTLRVVEIGKAWWEEIQKGSKRDQLSLMYVIWKHRFEYEVLKDVENLRKHSDYRFCGHAKKIRASASFDPLIDHSNACTIKRCHEELNRVYQSRSWRYTAPLGKAGVFFRGILKTTYLNLPVFLRQTRVVNYFKDLYKARETVMPVSNS